MKKYRFSAILLSLILSFIMISANIHAGEIPADNTAEAGTASAADSVYRVVLPSEKDGVTVRTFDSTAVTPGESFTFYLAPAKGWQKGSGFSVKAGDRVLKPSAYGEAGDPADQIRESGSTEGVPADSAEENVSEGDSSGQPEGDADNVVQADGTDQTTASDSTGNAVDQDGADNSSAVSGSNSGSTGSAALTERALAAKGYEKYVLDGVTGNVTVTVSGMEKKEDAKASENAQDPGETDEDDVIPENDTAENNTEENNIVENRTEENNTEDNDIAADPAPEDDGSYGDNAEDLHQADQSVTDQESLNDVPEEQVQDSQDVTDQDPSLYEPADGVRDSRSVENEYGYGEDTGINEDAAYNGDSEESGTGSDGSQAVTGDSSSEGYSENPAENTDDTATPASAASTGSTGDSASGSSASSSGNSGDSASGSSASNSGDSASGSSRNGTANSGDSSSSSSESSSNDDSSKVSVTGYPLWIGGVQATSKNTSDITGDGTVSFDSEKLTLTLKGAKISGHGKSSAPVFYSGPNSLTIVFSGDCSITDKTGAGGIVSESNSLIFDGAGTLTVTTAATTPGASIMAQKGAITFQGGTVKAVCSDSGAGILAGNIKITDDAVKVEATSKKNALSAGTKITIGSLMYISKPSKGEISSNGKYIVDSGGKTAASAVIEHLPDCKVTYDPGEGTGTMNADKVIQGKKLELPECDFTAPRCKTFSEWKIGSKTYAAGTSVTIKKDVTATAQWKDSHTLSKVEASAPTCLKDGNIEYYRCSVCKKYFSDSSAAKEISEADTVVKATGHNWGTPEYTWASDYSYVTAKRVCRNDTTHIESEKVSTTRTGTGPTCEKAGTYTYTASFSNSAFKKQIKNVKKEALGHLWSKHKFEWEQDEDGHYEAYCLFTCERDSSHKKYVEVDIKTSVKMPTRTVDGKMTCTGTSKFENKTYTDTKTETISPAGTSKYKFREADDSWTHGSSHSMKYRVKRSSYDMITYKAFSHITMDGKTVNSSNYSIEEGSLKLKLNSSYLETLAAGKHTLVIEFKDGTATHTINIKDKAVSNSNSPSTGDHSGTVLWIIAFAACAASVFGLLVLKFAKSGRGRRR